jgi:hypothetical protein
MGELSPWPHKIRHVGHSGMSSGDDYRAKAAKLHARAQYEEKDPAIRAEFENLARSFLRLAEQADRNSQIDVVYKTSPNKVGDQEIKR